MFVFALAACSSLASGVGAAQTRNVLTLFSANRLLPANIEADRGLREEVGKVPGRSVQFFAEFLDRPTFSGEDFDRSLATYLRDKYAQRLPDVLVAAGQPALEFLLRYRAEVFHDRPVVHLAVDPSFFAKHPPMPADVVGVPMVYDFQGTVEQALRWHPDARRLIVVTGASTTDRSWEAKARSDLARVAGLPAVEYLAGQATDVVLARLAALGTDALVLTPGYFMDGAGRFTSPYESVIAMAAVSRAPVYGTFSTFLGTGVVGGRMPTYVELGRQAARAVNGLLAGVAPTGLALPSSNPSQMHVDWRQTRRWNIAERDMPKDAVFHFREPTFWEAYRTTVIAALAVMLLQGLLIGALLLERRRRQRTAKALAESEQHMNMAARAARLSMWIWDVTRDRFWTSVDWIFSGRAKPPVVAFQQVLETVHPLDRERFGQAVRQAVDRDEELDVEYRMLQPSGEVRWIAARGRLDGSEGEAGRLMGVALDITARKEAELQAGRDRDALTHMGRVSMMGQLSASVGHQLNQPLAAILGNAETARKMLDRGDLDVTELKNICDDIVTENRRASDIIRRLGALYKRGEMNLAPLDLNELVNETLDLLRNELQNRHMLVSTELDEGLVPVDAGRVQLQQVLLNLILNAADAMHDNPPDRRKVTVRTTLEGTQARLCVVDQGCGVAPEDQKSIFEPFWTTKTTGVGVGLAICKAIVAAHRGTLNVANNPEGGATFCLMWPVRAAPLHL